MHKINILEYLKSICFIILFAWISFFPQPIQEKFWAYTVVFLGIFLLLLILNKEYRYGLFSFKDWPFWIFLICLFSGTISAANKDIALKTYFYLILTFSPLFYIGKSIFRNEKSRDFICITICLCSSIVAIIGLLELYFGKNIIYEKFIFNPYYARNIEWYSNNYIKNAGWYPQAMSTQLNPAVLGSYLLASLAFGFYLLKKPSFSLKLLGAASSFLCVIMIIFTFSRGVFLGFIALILFYLWNAGLKRLFVVFVLCSILLVSISSFAKDTNFYRFGFKRMIFGIYDSAISEYRLDRIKMTYVILKDYPVYGIGFQHFRIRFNEFYERVKGKQEIKGNYEFMILDNMYLTFLAESGIIGMLGFLVFIIFLLKNTIKKYKILLIPISVLIGLLVNMSAYELFYWNNPYMFFCLICGFIKSI